jgi:hypothetical protein
MHENGFMHRKDQGNMEDLSMLFSIPDSFPLIEVLIQKVAKVIHGNMAVLATATKPPEADSTCRRCRYVVVVVRRIQLGIGDNYSEKPYVPKIMNNIG